MWPRGRTLGKAREGKRNYRKERIVDSSLIFPGREGSET